MDSIDISSATTNCLPDGNLPPGFKSTSSLTSNILKRAEIRRASTTEIIGLPTGISCLDSIIDGLEPGDFILIGSRPSMGKTGLVTQICGHIAAVERKAVAIFGFDQSAEKRATRIIGNQQNIDGMAFHRRLVSETAWQQFQTGLDELKTMPLYIDAPCQKSFYDLIDCAEELKSKIPGLALILIDDIQGLLEQTDEELDGELISDQLKTLAKDTGTCVIATTGLPRALESRRDKRPTLRDFREIGRLDAHADVVCGIYREDYYNPECKDRNKAELILAKNVKCRTMTIDLRYEGIYGRFSDLYAQYPPVE